MYITDHYANSEKENILFFMFIEKTNGAYFLRNII